MIKIGRGKKIKEKIENEKKNKEDVKRGKRGRSHVLPLSGQRTSGKNSIWLCRSVSHVVKHQ